MTKTSDEGIEMQFQVIEQTEFIDDASFQPFKGNAVVCVLYSNTVIVVNLFTAICKVPYSFLLPFSHLTNHTWFALNALSL